MTILRRAALALCFVAGCGFDLRLRCDGHVCTADEIAAALARRDATADAAADVLAPHDAPPVDALAPESGSDVVIVPGPDGAAEVSADTPVAPGPDATPPPPDAAPDAPATPDAPADVPAVVPDGSWTPGVGPVHPTPAWNCSYFTTVCVGEAAGGDCPSFGGTTACRPMFGPYACCTAL